MSKPKTALGFLAGAAALAVAGAAAGSAFLDGEAWKSAALGVALGWAGTTAGFLILLPALESSRGRFLGAYAAGVAARAGTLGAALALALRGWGRPAPLLVAAAATLAVLLILESALLGAAGAGR
jgi:hypothetical protein